MATRVLRCVFVFLLLSPAGCQDRSTTESVPTDRLRDTPSSPHRSSASDALAEVVERIATPHQIEIYRGLLGKLAADAHDVEARLQMVRFLQTIGLAYLRDDDRPRARYVFQISFETALPLPPTLPETRPDDADLLATVYYNGACVLAQNGDISASIQALDRAFEAGFTDFLMLDEDADLAAVRSAESFAARYQHWKKQTREKRIHRAQEELAGSRSFPFDFQVTDIEGKEHRLDDFRGKVVLIDVWGTWCPPCRAEIPSLIRLQSQYADQGLQVLGLNYEGDTPDPLATVRQFVTRQEINYPCALGTPEIRDQIPNFEGFPTTLFVDRRGSVRLKIVGLHDDAYLESIVTALLAEPTP